MRTTCLVAVGLALLVTAPASARDLPSETPDDVAQTDRDVNRIAAANGSRTLLFGDFVNVGAPEEGGAVVSAVSGEPRLLPENVGDLAAVIPDAAGGWYAGGSRHLHRLRADGSVDPAFSVTVGDTGTVRGLALSADGSTLWVTGTFSTINGESRPGVAALDAVGGQLLPWRFDTRIEGNDIALAHGAVYVSGTLIAPGNGGGLVALDAATGALRATAATEIGVALALAPDAGTVYVATYWDGVQALDPATLAERWRGPAGVEAKDLAITPDGARLYVSGVGGVRQFDTASGTRTAWSVPLTAAWAMALSPDGETAYVGRGQAPGWPPIGAIAFATRDGALLGWFPGTAGGYSVDSLAVSRDGADVFLESSPTIGTRPRASGVLLDETGRPTPWVPPLENIDVELDAHNTAYTALGAIAADGTPLWPLQLQGGSATLTLSPDQRTVYLTGAFTAVNGVARPGTAAVRAADGALLPWSSSVSGGYATASVVSPDGGTVYLSGTFTAVAGVPRRGLAAVDAATGAPGPFDPALAGPVGAPKLSPDGSVLYVHPGYGDYGLLGLRVSDGAVVFDPAVDYVRAFVPLADGETVMIAANGLRPLGAWDARTGARLPWRDVDCVDCEIKALALDPDGRTLHVGGRFEWGGVGRNYLRLAVGRVAPTPVNVLAPRVIGTPQPGRFVECDPGAWSGHPSAYRFAWTLDGTPVDGFDGRALLVEAGDAGRALQCSVSAGGEAVASPPVTVLAMAAATFARRLAVPSAAGGPPVGAAGPEPFALRTPDPGPPPARPGRVFAGAARIDHAAPRVTLAGGRTVRLTLSERARVTTTLRRGKRATRRTFTLAAGRHTLTVRRLSGRARLARGRYTLTVQVRDLAGNAAVAQTLRFRVAR